MPRSDLLREIKQLGGDSTDLDLLDEVLSDDERDQAGSGLKPNVVVCDEASLMKDLGRFISSELSDLQSIGLEAIGLDSDEDESPANESPANESPANESPANDENDANDNEELISATYGAKDESDIKMMVTDILNGNEPDDKLHKSLLVEPGARWWLNELPSVTQPTKQNVKLVAAKFKAASDLWTEECAKFSRYRLTIKSNADKEFISTVLKSGTVTDKVSALTLLIQESPVHQFAMLKDQLMAMARKKSRRETLLAVDSIKDLLVSSILPDRKLKYFVDQPVLAKDVSFSHLILWAFEDALKKLYFEFIQLLEELLKDPVLHFKNKILACISELLIAKPEEEQNLLTLLVNKMGDLDNKIASKAAHLLSQVLIQHSAMKAVVVKEVERLLFRPNIGERAQYYAVTFLNQIILTRAERDIEVANCLIAIYFRLFGIKQSASKPGDGSKKKDDVTVDGNDVNSKMMAALLTGVNRAFPFSKVDESVFEAHLDSIFRIMHVGSFNTSVQALSLIFQVQTAHEMVSDRFYRALYAIILDRRLFASSKQSMYLNLLFKALKSDASLKRVRSFIKRIVQSCSLTQVPLVCGYLYLLGELARHRPGLWTLVSQPEEIEDDGAKVYDGRKRDPLFTNADQVCLWELNQFALHFHPTVSLYAKTLLSGNPIAVPSEAKNYDPLQNHTLTRFLDRFVFKTPKKVKTPYHGDSLMQPRVLQTRHTDMLLAGGRKKRSVVFEDKENADAKPVLLDDAPVTQMSWDKMSEQTVVPDEKFFYAFFNKKGGSAETKVDTIRDSDVDSDQDLDDDEVWDAMRKSAGFPNGGDGEDDSGDDVDDTLLDELDNIEYSDDEEKDEIESDGEEDMFSKAVIDDEDDLDATDDEDMQDKNEDQDTEMQKDQDKKKKRLRLRDRMAQTAESLGYKGDFFATSGINDFASSTDFAHLLNNDDDEDGLKRKRHSKVNGSNKRRK